jgi:hypothetical protein
MSFGVEQSQGVGGQTLGGFIADKAMKSRDDAKKEKERQKKVEEKGGQVEDKDKKGLFRKALAHNFGGGFFSGKKSFGEHFNYKMPPKPESPKQQTPSGGGSPSGGSGGGKGAGLAKILTGGFGSLVADTTAIQGGLTAITQLLNSQLQSSSFTANGISGITAILADQLEAQGEMIDLMGGNRPSGGAATASGMFGVGGSVKTGGKTLTEAAINAAIEKGIGRFLLSRLSKFNPFQKKPDIPRGPSGPKGYYDDAVNTSKRNAQRFSPPEKPKGFGQQLQDIGSGLKGKANQAVDFGKGVLGKAKGFGDNAIKGITGSPIAKRLALAGSRFGGRMIPVLGTGFSAVESADRAKKGDVVGAWLAGIGGGAGATATATSAAALTGAGAAIPAAAEVTSMAADIGLLGWDLVQAFNPASKMSSGGVMLGEAGKEAVVDLNSANAKTSGASPEDPGMKASGASMLAVVDQFVKGMGPLGTPVAQALGPDVQNLARKFGMSQALPNLKIGGGKFRENGNAKKERNKFLENLIAGSLESLDAKKKEDKSTGTTQTQTKQEQKKQSNPSNPDTGSATETKTGADGKPMDTHDPKAYGAGRQSVVTATPEGTGITDVDTNRQTGQLEANHIDFDHKGSRYKVRINPNNGDYEVFKKGANFGFDQKIDIGGPQGPKKGQANEALLKIAHNEVRRFFLVNAPQKGLALKYINQGDIDKNTKAKADARVNGNQQRGGIVKQEFDRGGLSVLDDLLRTTAGNVGGEIGAREGRRKTGNMPILGDIGERIGRNRGKTKGQETYDTLTSPFISFEKGGSMFGVTNVKNEITVEQRLDDVEKVLAMMTGVLGILSPGIAEPKQSSTQSTASPPRSAPAAPPIAATNQVADEMSNAAIINVIQSGGSSPTIQKSDSVQNTAEYASDPSCGGLASVLCVSSPWGSM